MHQNTCFRFVCCLNQTCIVRWKLFLYDMLLSKDSNKLISVITTDGGAHLRSESFKCVFDPVPLSQDMNSFTNSSAANHRNVSADWKHWQILICKRTIMHAFGMFAKVLSLIIITSDSITRYLRNKIPALLQTRKLSAEFLRNWTAVLYMKPLVLLVREILS